MTDFVSKTTELATLVGALHQQGEDDSDLTGILAQLQAAITKRVSSNAEKESLLATSYSNLETQLEVSNDSDLSHAQANHQDKCPNKLDASKRKTKFTKTAKVTAGKELTTEVPESGENTEKISWEAVFGVGTNIKTEFNDEVEVFSHDQHSSASISDTGDEEVRGSKTNKKSGGGTVSFQGRCKICEVQAVLNRDDSEDQMMLAQLAMAEPPDGPIFSSLIAFSAHIKGEHAVVVETEEDAAGASTDISTPKEVVVNGTLSSAEDITVNADIKLEPSNQNNQTLNGESTITSIAKQDNQASSKTKQTVLFLVCPHCSKRYNLHGTAKSCYDQLAFHMHKKHGEALPTHVTLYSCKECHFQTLRRRDLARHTYVVHTDHEPRGVPCEVCGKRVLRTSMVFHMAAVHGAEDVPDQVKARTAKAQCSICGKEFRGEVNLQRHIKCVHNKVKDQLCHLCSQSFFAKRELQLHMFATHRINISNMKVLKCPAEGCTYETLAKRHLQIHSTVHYKTKDFTCEHCGKAFRSKPALAQHRKILHTNDVEYKCTQCGFSSHAKQYVQRHMVIHSETKRHKCDFEGCSYATHYIENLTKHKKKHKSKDTNGLLENSMDIAL